MNKAEERAVAAFRIRMLARQAESDLRMAKWAIAIFISFVVIMILWVAAMLFIPLCFAGVWCH